MTQQAGGPKERSQAFPVPGVELPPIAFLNPPQLVAFLSAWQQAVVLLGTTSPQNFLSGVAQHYGGPQPTTGLGYFNIRGTAEQAWIRPLVESVLPGGSAAVCRGYYLFQRGLAVGYHPGLYDPRLDESVRQAERLAATSRSNPDLQRAQGRFQRIADEAANLVNRHFDALLQTGAAADPDPYRVLGLPPTADYSEVRAAYLARLREAHPDRMTGMDPQTQQAAHERAQEIIRAYKRLRERIGPSGDSLP